MLVMPQVTRLVAPNPSLMTGQGTNTYIFGRGDLAIVDPGPDDAGHVEAIVAALRERGGQPVLILVTHTHLDHLPGAFALKERLGVPIAAYAPVLGIDIGLRHEQRLTIGGMPVRALHTPGHAADHVCFWLEEDAALFSGDLIVGEGTVVIGRDGDLDDYLRSLDTLLSLNLHQILPGHGPVITEPRRKIEEYIAHRRERERQIVVSLASGPLTPGDIVEAVYVDLDPRLSPVAAQTVEAHLRKLVREGVVVSYRDAGQTYYHLPGGADDWLA